LGTKKSEPYIIGDGWMMHTFKLPIQSFGLCRW
jgi:hypothetical protein